MKTAKREAKRSLATKAESRELYFAKLNADKRRALEKLRKDIQAAAPKAEECMSYGIPGFRLNGKLLVSYGAAAKHCAFYPGSIAREFAEELKDYDTSGKGTIRFSAEKPLSAALVRRIVKARIARQQAPPNRS
jgi:uncharacterized protein YdhG (YjbR/CyaY superfamily)